MPESYPSASSVALAQPGGDGPFAGWRFEGITVRRILAYAIDVALVGVLLALAMFAGMVLTVLTLGLAGPLLGLVSFAVILVGYTTLLVGGPQSATFGMRLVGIEVRRLDGRRPDYLLAGVSVVLFYVLHVATSWLLLLVALFNRRGRLVQDFLCGTVVVRTDPVTER
ncbi:RDD family protein [Desertibaculum subflavum]|uniref:RDD family protein n=1 Tax=Desertibaculum subflavum TaxID=2268458 RepID=UPI0013C4A1CE